MIFDITFKSCFIQIQKQPVTKFGSIVFESFDGCIIPSENFFYLFVIDLISVSVIELPVVHKVLYLIGKFYVNVAAIAFLISIFGCFFSPS